MGSSRESIFRDILADFLCQYGALSERSDTQFPYITNNALRREHTRPGIHVKSLWVHES